MPGPGWFLIGEAERAQVLDALESRALSRYRFEATDDEASKTMMLERVMALVLGVRHVLAVNSGTSALLCALRALGVGPGDEVVVPGYTFIASIAAVLYVGATPVLAEVDDSLTIDPSDVEKKITPNTAAIMAVHMIGAPADLSTLGMLAESNGVALVEDVAQACGGRYRGRYLGAHGRVSAFSLNVGKIITTGEGGLVATNDRGLYERAFAVHDHGFRPQRAGVSDDGPLLGLNLRMNELGAAVGLAQAMRLEDVLQRCRRNHATFREVFLDISGTRERVVHDQDGECSTAHVLLFASTDRARGVAEALGGRTLADSPKHNYATMTQLQRLLDHGSGSQPPVRFGRPGDLPRTDAVLSRSVAFAIGVVDGYLGTLGDVTVLDHPDEVRAKAWRMRSRVETVR